MMTKLGNYIKKIRIDKGFSLRQVGIQSGLNYSYVSLVENGKRSNLQIETLKKLAKGLRIPVSNLYKVAGISKEHILHPEDYSNGHFDIAKAIEHKHYMTWQGKPLTDLDKQMLIKMFGGGDSKHE